MKSLWPNTCLDSPLEPPGVQPLPMRTAMPSAASTAGMSSSMEWLVATKVFSSSGELNGPPD